MTMPGRSDIVDEIGRLLDQVELADPSHKAVIAEIRRLVRALVSSPGLPARRRTGEGTQYLAEGKGDQASLAEYRASGQPLRVTRHAYDLVVDALAVAQRPLPFDDLMASVGKAVDPPSDWQVRVVLRYLLRADPPILRRSRSRYQPVTPGKFSKAAGRWWATAAKVRPSSSD